MKSRKRLLMQAVYMGMQATGSLRSDSQYVRHMAGNIPRGFHGMSLSDHTDETSFDVYSFVERLCISHAH